MLSALIQSSFASDTDKEEEQNSKGKAKQMKLNNAFRVVPKGKQPHKPPTATLIIAPTSLLSQWSEELQRSSKPGTLDVLVWHGQNRLDIEATTESDGEEDKTIKVVITSYGVLASEHAKSAKSPIFES